jgi:hypothetical protein
MEAKLIGGKIWDTSQPGVWDEMGEENLSHFNVSLVVLDELTKDGVRIQVAKENGRIYLIGRGDLLNWLCDQLTQFRGLEGDSLPDGRVIYQPKRNSQGDNRACLGSLLNDGSASNVFQVGKC